MPLRKELYSGPELTAKAGTSLWRAQLEESNTKLRELVAELDKEGVMWKGRKWAEEAVSGLKGERELPITKSER